MGRKKGLDTLKKLLEGTQLGRDRSRTKDGYKPREHAYHREPVRAGSGAVTREW